MKPSSGHWNEPSGKSRASPSTSQTPLDTSGRGNASSDYVTSSRAKARLAKPLRVSIIIPTLNEATTIEDCLDQFDCVSGGSDALSGQGARGGQGGQGALGKSGGADGQGESGGQSKSGGADGRGLPDVSDVLDGPEIIVVDGGSDDGTAEIVRSRAEVRFIELGNPGRAVQMNEGAAASSGDVLLFLHADTRLPVHWRELVAESISGRGKAGGRFRFDIAHARRIYRWIARGTNFRSRFLGITYGDQAIYTTREAFETVGGFPGIPVFEDARFADRLKKTGGLDWIDEAVLTSARRWERRGPVRTLMLTWLLRLLYTLFVPARFLARFYGVVR